MTVLLGMRKIMKISIELKNEGRLEREIPLPNEEDGVKWKTLVSEFLFCLKGLSYNIPQEVMEEFDEEN